MNKVIRIFKGDEYRPKIEKEFRKDDFFAEVYERAYSILKEIQEEMHARRLENGEEQHFALEEGSVGNNIIAFCGRRGQGKSSAMQSFARTLDNMSQWKTFGNEVDCSNICRSASSDFCAAAHCFPALPKLPGHCAAPCFVLP